MDKKDFDKKSFYEKKQRERMLHGSIEFTTSRLGWQITLAASVIILFLAFDFKTMSANPLILGVAAVYALCTAFQFLVYRAIMQDMFRFGEISKKTRMLGFVLIPLVATGNFFLSIAGFMLVRKDKGIEYSLSVYSLLITLFIGVVSFINIFKESVSQYFVFGMIGLVAIAAINLIVMWATCKFCSTREVPKAALPFAILAIIAAAIGNAFSLLLGIIMLAKIFHKNKEVSIEWVDVIRRLFKNYMSVIGLFFISFLLSISIYSYLTFDYDMAIVNNYSALLLPPSLMFPFGTDNFGRCLFTRIIFGARISLVVGLISTAIPIMIGGILGAISGYYGKTTDNVIMRLLDILYAVPGILLAIAIIAAFGANTFNLIMALSIGAIPMYARTVRATVLTLSGQEFVEAAKACGAKDSLIIFKHIIPNSLAPIIVRSTLGIGGAVLSTSSLSYLGLGVEPHIPEWGNILKAGSTYLELAPHIAIFPGLAIILIVLAFNYFGDGLRDALDPKLK